MMQIRLFALMVLASLTIAGPAFASGYVGNAFGIEGRYQVFEFTDDGRPFRPISGAHAVAWPSGIRVGEQIFVYGVENVSGKWDRVRLFSSSSGAAYQDQGVVFSADATEPHGIGPATVSYDGAVYRLYYLIRGAAGPGAKIGLATSLDGKTFVRQDTAYVAGTEAAGGLAVSYACSDEGQNYLLIHAYSSDLSTATSIVATAPTPDGPYSYAQTLLQPTNSAGTLTGSAGNAFAQFTGSLTVGRPIVVNDAGASVYVPVSIHGSTVYLDRPLEKRHIASSWADFVRNKIDMSFIRKDVDGGWSGAVTGYGAFDGVLSEYTSPLTAETVLGQWKLAPGYHLSPYFNSGRYSTENPEPIRETASCSE